MKLAPPAGWRLDGRADVLVPVVAPGRSWQRTWTVRPDSPSGDRVTLSASATHWTAWGERSLTADGGAPIVSPPAPGVTALSRAAWFSAENGYGPVERGTSNGEAKAGDGHRITIGGVPYDDGLGVHAPSRVRFYLGGGCTAFGASVGHDDEKPKGSVAFQVLGDGKELAETGVMTAGLPAQRLAADLGGVQVLDLVVTDGTDSDHADWADATITC